jgi:hypothetical protein
LAATGEAWYKFFIFSQFSYRNSASLITLFISELYGYSEHTNEDPLLSICQFALIPITTSQSYCNAMCKDIWTMMYVKGHFHFICDKIVKFATGALYVLPGPFLYAAAISQGTTVNHTNYTFHNSLQLCMYLHEMQWFLIADQNCPQLGEVWPNAEITSCATFNEQVNNFVICTNGLHSKLFS